MTLPPSPGPVPEPVFDLRRLDLNLVVPLHALLVERSVSSAARRVGLTQPAVSKSLQRLRQHFGDDLLVRSGRSSTLTPFAATLLPEVDALVTRLGGVLTPRDTFDPSTTRRRFTLAASDYLAVTFGSDLVEALRREAPEASLDLVELEEPPIHNQLSAVDALVLPAGLDPRLHHAVPLLMDEWCLVIDPALAEEARTWTPESLVGRGFVLTSIHGFVPGQMLLERLGFEVDVRITAPTFAAVPFLVRGTDHVGVVGRQLAQRLAAAAGVTVVDAPWHLPGVPYQLYSDLVRRQDAGTRWFLDVVGRVARKFTDQE